MDADAQLDDLAQKLTDLTARWQSSPPPVSMDAAHPLVGELHGLLQAVQASVAEGKKQLKAKLQEAMSKAQAKKEAHHKTAAQPPSPPSPNVPPSPVDAAPAADSVTLRFEQEHSPPTEQMQEVIKSLLATQVGKDHLPDYAEIQATLKKLGLTL